MRRRGRTREVVDLIHFELERVDDVVPDKLETRMGQQVRDVRFLPGKEIVDTNDLVPVLDQSIAEMRTQEAGPAGAETAPGEKLK